MASCIKKKKSMYLKMINYGQKLLGYTTIHQLEAIEGNGKHWNWSITKGHLLFVMGALIL